MSRESSYDKVDTKSNKSEMASSIRGSTLRENVLFEQIDPYRQSYSRKSSNNK